MKVASKTRHISQGMCLIVALRGQAAMELRLHTGTKLIIFGICGEVVRQGRTSAEARRDVKAVGQARRAVLETRQKAAKARFKR